MESLWGIVNVSSLVDSILDLTAEEDTHRRLAGEAYVERVRREGQSLSPADSTHVLEKTVAPFAKKLKVSYYKPYNLPGRLYAAGPSVQSLPNRLRRAALSGTTARDIDMRCAHLSILNRFLHDHGAVADFPITQSLVCNVEEWRSFVSSVAKASLEEAKTAINSIAYGKTPVVGNDVEIPEMYVLAKETRLAATEVVGDERFRYLQNHVAFQGRRTDPLYSMLSYALGAIEDDLLCAAKRNLPSETRNIAANLFDGLIVNVPGGEWSSSLRT